MLGVEDAVDDGLHHGDLALIGAFEGEKDLGLVDFHECFCEFTFRDDLTRL